MARFPTGSPGGKGGEASRQNISHCVCYFLPHCSVSPSPPHPPARRFERGNVDKFEMPPELQYTIVNMEETLLDQ